LKIIKVCLKVFLAIMIFCVPILVHESFHAYFTYELTNVRIEEMGFGIPVLKKYSIAYDFPENFFIKKFRFNLIPLIAYVNPGESDKVINSLPIDAKLKIYSAGIIGNFCFSMLFIIGYLLYARKWLFNARKLIIASGALSLIWFFLPKISLLFPLIGILLIYITAMDIRKNKKDSGFYGPIGLVTLLADALHSPKETCALIALISMALGFMNMIPLSAIDGGKIVITILDSYKINHFYYELVSALLILQLFAYTIYVDLKRIFSKNKIEENS
jgi:hypothetical protein